MNKILLIASVVSFNLFAAQPVTQFGRIVDLKGSGFISYKGKTHEITKGDVIEFGSEIIIEHSGQVTFTDNADHRFHLSNSSSAAVSAAGVELRGGDLWFQSLNKTDDSKIQTANATVNYQGGEALLSYDNVKGKTQLMVINSMMKLSNLRAPELNLNVAEGHFSFIDNAYEEGAPRDPTPVGEKTYGQLVSMFSGIAPMDKNSANVFKNHDKAEHVTGHVAETAKVEAGRSIASVSEESKSPENKSEKKAEIDSKALEEYKNSMLHNSIAKKVVTNKASKTKVVKKMMTAETLVVHIYGQTSAPVTAEVKTMVPNVSSRAPASVLDQDVPVDSAKSTAPTTPANLNPYSKDYKNQYKESDKLIEDLKKL